MYETYDAYYISLAIPRNIYDKIVVIDAGHGGIDEGVIYTAAPVVTADFGIWMYVLLLFFTCASSESTEVSYEGTANSRQIINLFIR